MTSVDTLPVTIPPAAKSAGLTRAFLRLKRLVQKRRHHVRLGTVLVVFGQDGLLALNAMLCLLNIVLSPLQGISLPLGIVQLIILTAVLRNRKTFWLPRRWRSKPFETVTLQRYLNAWLPRLYTLEKISRPRFTKIMQRKTTYRITVWLLWVLAFIVATPIPFMNITPSAAALFLSIGLINRDGIMWLLGMALAAAHSLLYFFWSGFWPHVAAMYHSWLP